MKGLIQKPPQGAGRWWWRLTLAAGLAAALGWGMKGLVAGRQNAEPPSSLAASGVDPGTALGLKPAPGLDGLIDQNGRPVRLRNLQGRPIWLTFFNAADNQLSPLVAQVVWDAEVALGPSANRVAVLAVNLDPEANPRALAAWNAAHHMSGRWTALTGPSAVLFAVAQRYHVAEATPTDHVTFTPALYLIDPKGREDKVYLVSPDPALAAAQASVIAQNTLRWLPGATLHPISGQPLTTVAAQGRFTAPVAYAPLGSAQVQVGAGTPYVVAFFATWCPSCEADLATLSDYQRARHSHPSWPPLVAVDLKVAEPPTVHLRSWLAAHQVSFPVVEDATGKLAEQYGVPALPYLALVSSQGSVEWTHVGAVDLATLEQAVERLQSHP
ncbi:MAG: redoxin domain-containing protein [Firmicutes bacterium]|nr:redoxin domain-containing protein [Bacillota bacterium]